MKKPPKKILITEDNAFILRMMQKTLVERGLNVRAVRSAQEAIDAIKEDPPHLLLLDLLLPKIDGFTVLIHCRDTKKKFPIVICSNVSDTKTRERCKNFGVAAFVVKSDIDDQQLGSIVDKHLP
jgi:CheY-like chemotaxis protein